MPILNESKPKTSSKMKSVTLGAVRDAPPRFIAAVPKSPSGKILRRLLKHAPPS